MVKNTCGFLTYSGENTSEIPRKPKLLSREFPYTPLIRHKWLLGLSSGNWRHIKDTIAIKGLLLRILFFSVDEHLLARTPPVLEIRFIPFLQSVIAQLPNNPLPAIQTWHQESEFQSVETNPTCGVEPANAVINSTSVNPPKSLRVKGTQSRCYKYLDTEFLVLGSYLSPSLAFSTSLIHIEEPDFSSYFSIGEGLATSLLLRIRMNPPSSERILVMTPLAHQCK